MWFEGGMQRRRRIEHRRQSAPSAAVAVALLNGARRMRSAARPFMQCVLVMRTSKQNEGAGQLVWHA